jgi:hypothetical protein
MSVFAVEPPSKLTVKSYVSETFNSGQAIQIYLKSFKSPLERFLLILNRWGIPTGAIL